MAYSDFKVGIGVDFLTSNADLQAQLNRYSKNLKVNATVGVDFTKAQVEAKDAAMQIQKILQQAYKNSTGNNLSDKDAQRYTTRYLREYINMTQIASNANNKLVSDMARISKGETWRKWADNNTKAMKKFGTEINECIERVRNLDVAMNKNDMAALEAQFKQIQSNARQTGLLGMAAKDRLTNAWEKFGGWSLATGSLMAVWTKIREIPKNVYDIDTAMTNLYKVTDETSERYNRFLDSAIERSERLGVALDGLITQTSEWAKLGYSLDDAEKLSEYSAIYKNVGEVDDKTAVSDMVTAMKAFNIEASDAIKIIDELNILGNKYAVSSADLGDGLSKSASAMATAGSSMEKTLAMLTGGSEITQSAGEFGNMLKVASMRIRGMKGELEALGEEVDDSVDSISKVQTQILNLTHGGVNIFDAEGNFRDYYDIMEDISKIYDQISSTDQAALMETLFGKQRGNQGAALIQAFQSGQVQKAYQDALNSQGSAKKEQERWLDSIEAKLKQNEAAFQSLSNTILSSNLFKYLVDGGTDFLNILNSMIKNTGILIPLVSDIAIKNVGEHYIVPVSI